MKFLVFFISLSILFFSLNSLPVNHFGIAKQNLPDAMNAMTGPLIAGTGKFLSDGGLDGFNTTYSIDLTTNASNLIIDNLPFSGATFNLTTNQVLFTSSGSGLIGSNLYSLTPETWDVTLLGVVHSTKGDLRIDGLAMVEDNLYGAHEIMDDNGEAGLYIIDQSTYLATFLFSFTNLAIGGIDADQVSGTIYGLDDISKEFVEIGLDGSITPIVAYPNGETDLDGLAISPDHKAYIIPDETGSIYIYNLVTQEFETPINTPWTYLDNFSGGAFISYPIINV